MMIILYLMTKYSKHNDFDFNKVNITENQYYNHLDYIFNLDWVDTIDHSLPLNKIIIKSEKLSNDTKINFCINDISDKMIIKNIFIEDDILEVQINTLKLILSKDDNKSEYFPGKYTNEVIYYLSAELQLINEFEPIDIIEKNTKSELKIKSVDTIKNLNRLKDIFSHMGFSVSEFTIENKIIKSLNIYFNESTIYNQENIEKFQEYKYNEAIKNIMNNSTPIELPSGIKSIPDVLIFSDCDDKTIKKFPVEEISAPPEINKNKMKLYKISVKDSEDAFLTISNWHNNEPVEAEKKFTAVSIQDGYVCSKTNTVYVIPKDSNLFKNIIDKENHMDTYTVEYKDNKKEFQLFNYN